MLRTAGRGGRSG